MVYFIIKNNTPTREGVKADWRLLLLRKISSRQSANPAVTQYIFLNIIKLSHMVALGSTLGHILFLSTCPVSTMGE